MAGNQKELNYLLIQLAQEVAFMQFHVETYRPTHCLDVMPNKKSLLTSYYQLNGTLQLLKTKIDEMKEDENGDK